MQPIEKVQITLNSGAAIALARMAAVTGQKPAEVVRNAFLDKAQEWGMLNEPPVQEKITA